MKLIIYSCLLLSVHWVKAQDVKTQESSTRNFTPGTWQLGVRDGYSNGNILRNRNVVQAQVGYYVANRLMVGVAGSLTKEWIGDIHSENLFAAGPVVRYQFTSSRISPFAELAYQFGKLDIGPFNARARQSLLFTPGLNVRLFSRLNFEGSYSFRFVPVDERIGQPQLGLNYQFGPRR